MHDRYRCELDVYLNCNDACRPGLDEILSDFVGWLWYVAQINPNNAPRTELVVMRVRAILIVPAFQ